MSRPFRRPLALAAILGVALLTLVAAGCSKKVAVDQIGRLLVAYPEGTRDSLERTPSDLIVWPDVPVEVDETSATQNQTYLSYRTRPGAMEGVIADYVQASGYRMYRQEEGGGYRQFTDFALTATKRWADRSFYGSAQGTLVLPPGQLFAFSDQGPATLPTKAYVGRAVISGVSGAGSPLTNLGLAPDTTDILPLRYTGLTEDDPDNPDPAARLDSLISMSWETIPGAASYWVHIYQKRADIRISEEAIAVALPSPIALGKARDLFIGHFPAPITSYKLGDPPPPGSRILVYRVLAGLQEVLIRVSAVDAHGRMIATTGSLGDRDSVREKLGNVERLRKFLLGAKRVTPGRPTPP